MTETREIKTMDADEQDKLVYLYAVYDEVSKEIGPLFEAVNDDVAIRYFRQSMKDVYSEWDYQLLRVGVFEVKNGELKLMDKYEEITPRRENPMALPIQGENK